MLVNAFYFYPLVPIVMQSGLDREICGYYVLSEGIWKQLDAQSAYISNFFYIEFEPLQIYSYCED